MSDAAAQPWNDSASAPSDDKSRDGKASPLDGDWSEGLQGAARPHGLRAPVLIDGPAASEPASEPAASPSRAAEELAAEAAGSGMPAESLRTEQASAKAIFALAEQRGSSSVIVAPLPPQETEPLPAVMVEPSVAKATTGESARLDEEVAKNIQDALALEGDDSRAAAANPDLWGAAPEAAPLAPPDAPTPWSEPAATPSAADPWAERTAAAGPEVWGGAAPAKDAWEAGPEAAAGPDWGAMPADPSAGAAWPTPSTEPTLMHAPLEAQAGEEDLPVPVPEPAAHEATLGRPAFLAGERRVVVHTLAGRVKRGTLRDPDLARPELRLSPISGGAEERISLTEVKTVFFMLAPGEAPTHAPSQRIRVTLSDGRQLEGFREGDGPGGGFYLVPLDAARTNTRAIFVCADAIQQIDQA